MQINRTYQKVYEVDSYKEGFTSELFFSQELVAMNLAEGIIKNSNMSFKVTPMIVRVSLDCFMPISIKLKEAVTLDCPLRRCHVSDLDHYDQIAKEYEYARKDILSKDEYTDMREVRNFWTKLLGTLRFMKLVNDMNFNFSELTKELTFEDVRNFKTELECCLLIGES
jgi:hypothetical protein